MISWAYLGGIIAVLGGTAALADILIGKQGNQWIKDEIIFKSWFKLGTVNFKEIQLESAKNFDNVFNRIFGRTLINRRAYVASLLLTPLTIAIAVVYYSKTNNFPMFPSLELNRGLGALYTNFWIKYVLVILGFVLIVNPMFDVISYAVTRKLIRIAIYTNHQVAYLFTWVIDLFIAYAIANITFYVCQYFQNLIIPSIGVHPLHLKMESMGGYNISKLFLFLKNKQEGVFYGFWLSGFVPTLFHLLFLLSNIIFVFAKPLSKPIIFLLERFDEKSENTLKVLATLLAAILLIVKGIDTLVK